MPRFKHQDKSSSSSRSFSSRMRVGSSSTINTSSHPKKSSTSTSSNTKIKGTTPVSKASSKEESTSASVTVDNDHSTADKDSNKPTSTNSSISKKDTDKFDYEFENDDDNQFSFDFDDEESTPPKAIIWKDVSANASANVNANDYKDYLSEDQPQTDLESPKAISILKDNSSLTPMKQRDATSSSSLSSLSSPPIPGSLSSKKVTFGNDVKFRQKTPVKVKRITKKKPTIQKSSHLSSSSRRKSSKSLSNSNVATSPSTSRSASKSKKSSSSIVRNAVVTPTTDMKINEKSSTSISNSTSTSTSTSKSTSNMSVPSWIPKRGVAIDSRVLETFAGDAVGRTFQNYVLQFLKSSSKRGLCPTILATTVLKERKQRNGKIRMTSGSGGGSGGGSVGHNSNAIETRAAHLPVMDDRYCKDDFWSESSIPLISIKPPSNVGNIKNRNVVHVPKRLLACDSWRTIGDLVEAIASEMSSAPSSNSARTPIEITIISNDVAIFTDLNIDSHKRALTRLWERLRPKFHSNLIRSVNIVIFESKVAALDLPNSTFEVHASNQPDDSNVKTSDDDVDNTPHRFKVAYCLREIQNHIVKLSEKEYNSYDRTERRNGMPMNLKIELKDMHPILFSSILQQWSHDALHSSTSETGRICFELPETFDGTQSAVALDLSYSILPYRLDSTITRGLLDDLKCLSNSYMEVVQLVPLDSIDLSLIYGTPLSAKAGIEGDLDQYKHMQVLVRLLFKYLGSHDVALVLRSSTSNSVCNYNEKNCNTCTFLLMAQVEEGKPKENDEKFRYNATGRGMLYRYVDKAEHIIEEINHCELNDCGDEEDEMVLFSSEYIENSLGLLQCLDLTPYAPSIENPHKFEVGHNLRVFEDKDNIQSIQTVDKVTTPGMKKAPDGNQNLSAKILRENDNFGLNDDFYCS